MMNKLFYSILFVCFCLSFTQGQTPQAKIDLIKKEEKKIARFAKDCRKAGYPQPQLDDYLEEMAHEYPNNQLPPGVKAQLIQIFMTDYCRKQYFKQNANAHRIYQPNFRAPAISCENGDFNPGIDTLTDALFSEIAIDVNQCDINAVNIPVNITSSPHIEVINSGPDSFMPGLSFADVPFIKLNRIEDTDSLSNEQSAIKFVRSHVLNSTNEVVFFDFALAFYYFNFHTVADQPYFTMRAVRLSDGQVFDEQCIIADENDPRLEYVTSLDFGDVISTNGWDCNFFNIQGLPGDTFHLEFLISDCKTAGHFGYAYLDNIYAESCPGNTTCTEPNYGNVFFTDPLVGVCHSDFPTQLICGQYYTPTDSNGSLFNADPPELFILNSTGIDVTQGPITLLTHNTTTGEFCFEVQPANFPNIMDDFEFEVVVDFELNGYEQSLSQSSTAYGPDVSACVLDCSCLTGASFTIDIDECTVDFEAIPGGSPCNLGYEWDFDNNPLTIESTSTNPQWTFDGPGPHCVLLIISDPSGNCTEVVLDSCFTLPNCIDCDCVTGANFSYVVDQCTGYFNVIPADPSCTFIHYAWDFNNDNIIDTVGLSVFYEEFVGPGPHDVTLFVSDSFAQCGVTEITQLISTPDCIDCSCVADADFTYIVDGCNIDVTIVPGGPGCDMVYMWEVNGSSAGTGPNPTIIVEGPGPHEIILIVSETTGQCPPKTIIKNISTPDCLDCDCIANSDFEFDIDGCEVDFNTVLGGSDCGALNYSWDFNNDGIEDDTAMNPSHIFNGPGPHTVTLIISDPAGNCVSKTIIKSFGLPGCFDCTCTAEATFAHEAEGCTVDFEATPGPGSCDLTYNWQFGDGNTGSGANPTHTYDGAGPYTVLLIISSPDCIDTISNLVSAPNCCGQGGSTLVIIRSSFESACVENNPCKPREKECDDGNVFDECFQACEGTIVEYYIDDPAPGANYVWQVLGGTILSTSASSILVEWPLIPLGSTSLDGLITVTEITAGGCETTVSRCAEITPTPKAEFTAMPWEGCLNQSIQFINQSSGEELTYFWDFGDGQTSIEESPAHTYTTSAIFDVMLVAVNACGCADTTINQVKIYEDVAHEIQCIGTVCAGDVVDYTIHLGDPSCSISDVDLEWSVGGGTIIDGQSTETITIKWDDVPIGQLSVQVLGCGCETTITESVPIITNNLNLYGPDVVCVGEQVTYYTECQPGRSFSWYVTGGSILSQNDQLNEIIVEFNSFGSYEIKVIIRENELLNCDGIDALTLVKNVDVVPHGEIEPVETEYCAEDIEDELFEVMVEGSPSTALFQWSILDETGATIIGGLGINYSVPVGTNLPAGNYSVQAVITSNVPPVLCNAIITHFISIAPKPAEPEFVSGAQSACPNETYTYIADPLPGHLIQWDIVGGTVSGQTTATGNEVPITWGISPPYEIFITQYDPQNGSCLSDPVHLIIDLIDASTYDVFYGSLAAPLPAVSDVCAGMHEFHTDAEALVYEWSVDPAYLGSIVSGQFTNDVAIAFHFDESNPPPYNNVVVRLNANICDEDITYEYTVDIQNPSVSISGPSDACVGASTDFNAIIEPAGTLATYVWIIDGTIVQTSSSSQLAMGNYEFNTDGVHSIEVEVIITDPSFACEGVLTAAATSINVSYPFAVNIIGHVYPDGCIPEYEVQALASAGGPYNFTWTDATGVIWTTLGDTQSILNITPANQPTGQVYVTIVDPSNPECVVVERIGASGCGGGGPGNCSGHSVFSQLSRSCTDYFVEFEIILAPGEEFFEFHFGDGMFTTTYAELLSHTYAFPNNYTAQLYIMENGATCLAHSLIINVRYPSPSFSMPSEVCEMTPVQINNTSGLGHIVEVIWSFGDGSNSNEHSPIKTYQDVTSPTSYLVTLTLIDDYGCEAETSQSVLVQNNDLVDQLTILPEDPAAACNDLTLSAVVGGAPPFAYDWFSALDQTSSIGIASSINISESGQYIVEVTDGDGCLARANSAFMTIYPEPVPLYSGASQYCEDDSIRFDALSGDQYDYQWNSSWGTTSSTSFFQEITPDAGTYFITMTVTNSTPVGDCAASTVIALSVHEKPLVHIVQPFACAPQMVSVQSPNPLYDYFWSNGAQGISTTALTASAIQVTAVSDVGCIAKDAIGVSEGINFCNMMVGCYEVCPGIWLAPPGYATYQWYEVDENGDLIPIPAPIGNDSIIDLTVVGEGSYQVMVTDQLGCSGLSNIVTFDFVLEGCDTDGKVCGIVLKDPSVSLGHVVCLGYWNGQFHFEVMIPYDNTLGNSGEIQFFTTDHPTDYISLQSSTFIAGGTSGFIQIILAVDQLNSHGLTMHYIDATGEKCKVDVKVRFPEECDLVDPCPKMGLKDKPIGQCIELLPMATVYEVTAIVSVGPNSVFGVEAIALNSNANVVSTSYVEIAPGVFQVTIRFHYPRDFRFRGMCFELIFDIDPKVYKPCIFKFCTRNFDHDCTSPRLAGEEDDLNSSALVFYPNPSSDIFMLDKSFTAESKAVQVVVLNAQGQVMRSNEINTIVLQTEGLNLIKYPSGLYMIRVSTAHKTYQSSVIKID